MKGKDKIPVTILTGFLGSGKTTLLNHILTEKHGMKIAVIENEFGEVGVDEHLVKQNVYSEEQVIETMNGCICCTVRGDLSKILKKLLVQEKRIFDGIIIQTTGMADPAPVAQTFFVDEVVANYTTLDGIITVVDAKHIIQHLKQEKGEGVQNESIEQIAFADKVILNKIDLVSKQEIEQVIKEIKAINIQVQIIKVQYSRVEPQRIIGIQSFKLSKVLKMDPEFLNIDQQHIHDQSISSCGCVIQQPISLGKLQSWISQLIQTKSADLYRYKGVINVVGMDRPYVFQGVHMLFSGTFLKSGWQQNKNRKTYFCFIGKNIDRDYLINGFNNCIAEKLRFCVGDTIQCKISTGPQGWKEGIIICEWDEGNPYRIKLENGDEVYCPEDSPQLIKLKHKAAAPLYQIFLQEYLDAEEIKTKGNELFVLQRYGEAIEKYENGIQILEKRFPESQLQKNDVIGVLYEKLLKNICLCLLRCQKLKECIELCNKILEKSKQDSKCHYMKGQALIGLNEYWRAKQSLEEGLKYGENEEIRAAIAKCIKMIGK